MRSKTFVRRESSLCCCSIGFVHGQKSMNNLFFRLVKEDQVVDAFFKLTSKPNIYLETLSFHSFSRAEAQRFNITSFIAVFRAEAQRFTGFTYRLYYRPEGQSYLLIWKRTHCSYIDWFHNLCMLLRADLSLIQRLVAKQYVSEIGLI